MVGSEGSDGGSLRSLSLGQPPRTKFPRSLSLSSDKRTLAVSPSCPQAMVKQGTWTVDDFTLIREIGRGRASVVHHAVCKLAHHPVALKVYKKANLTDVTRRQVEREIEIHAGVLHPHVIDCYVVFEDSTAFYMALEYAPGGDLMKVLSGTRQLTDKQAREALAQVMSALQHLHSKSVIHRDLKPENVLVTRGGTLKLADLGTAIDLRKERAVSRLGTLDYMAPEVLRCPDKRRAADNKEREDLMYCVAVDVWAVGILAFELITGRPPFERDSMNDTVAQIMSAPQACPAWMAPHATSFIHRALQKEPDHRPAMQQLAAHPFIADALSTALEEPSLAELLMPNNLLTRHRSLEPPPCHTGGEGSGDAFLPPPPPAPLHRAPSAPFPCSPLRSASSHISAPSPLSSPSRASRLAPPPTPSSVPRSPLSLVSRSQSCSLPCTRLASPVSRFACPSHHSRLGPAPPLTMRTLFSEESTCQSLATDASPRADVDAIAVSAETKVKVVDTCEEGKENEGELIGPKTPSQGPLCASDNGGSAGGCGTVEEGAAADGRSPMQTEKGEGLESGGRVVASPRTHSLRKTVVKGHKKTWQCDIRRSLSSANSNSSDCLTLSPTSSCGSISSVMGPLSPRTPSPPEQPCVDNSPAPGKHCPKRCLSFSLIPVPAVGSPRGVGMLRDHGRRRPTWPSLLGHHNNQPAQATK